MKQLRMLNNDSELEYMHTQLMIALGLKKKHKFSRSFITDTRF